MSSTAPQLQESLATLLKREEAFDTKQRKENKLVDLMVSQKVEESQVLELIRDYKDESELQMLTQQDRTHNFLAHHFLILDEHTLIDEDILLLCDFIKKNCTMTSISFPKKLIYKKEHINHLIGAILSNSALRSVLGLYDPEKKIHEKLSQNTQQQAKNMVLIKYYIHKYNFQNTLIRIKNNDPSLTNASIDFEDFYKDFFLQLEFFHHLSSNAHLRELAFTGAPFLLPDDAIKHAMKPNFTVLKLKYYASNYPALAQIVKDNRKEAVIGILSNKLWMTDKYPGVYEIDEHGYLKLTIELSTRQEIENIIPLIKANETVPYIHFELSVAHGPDLPEFCNVNGDRLTALKGAIQNNKILLKVTSSPMFRAVSLYSGRPYNYEQKIEEFVEVKDRLKLNLVNHINIKTGMAVYDYFATTISGFTSDLARLVIDYLGLIDADKKIDLNKLPSILGGSEIIIIDGSKEEIKRIRDDISEEEIKSIEEVKKEAENASQDLLLLYQQSPEGKRVIEAQELALKNQKLRENGKKYGEEAIRMEDHKIKEEKDNKEIEELAGTEKTKESKTALSSVSTSEPKFFIKGFQSQWGEEDYIRFILQDPKPPIIKRHSCTTL